MGSHSARGRRGQLVVEGVGVKKLEIGEFFVIADGRVEGADSDQVEMGRGENYFTDD